MVDDAEISPPGECKIETWGSFAGNGERLFAAVPSCTFRSLPHTEFGLEVIRAGRATSLAPYAKFAAFDFTDAGAGLYLAGGFSYGVSPGRIEMVYINAPATLALGEGLRLHGDLGYQRDRMAKRSHLSWGAGAELAAAPDFAVLAEVFGLSGEAPGLQAGLRPTVLGGAADIEIVYGRNLAGERAHWATVGFAARF